MADPTVVPNLTGEAKYGIQKRLLTPGKGGERKYEDGTKVKFHYVTRKCDEDHTVLDDSHDGEPMELIFGKKFKLEVWETCVKTMQLNEVSSFTVEPDLLSSYPLVAKSLRNIRKGKKADDRHHCCGMSLEQQGLGYPDLDALLKKPEKLEFIIELLQVEEAGGYQKEAWAMTEDEKLEALPRLREEGNKLYVAKEYQQAADKYAEAIGMLEQLLLREKPGDEVWLELDKKKVPFLLNYSQCMLSLGDFYPVIEHTSEVLKKDPENVKALFRRAKAHVGAWNPTEAEEDFRQVVKLDPSLGRAVQKELQAIRDMRKEKDAEDRAKLQGKMFQKATITEIK